MKKVAALLALAILSGWAGAQSVPENVTYTPLTLDPVSVPVNSPFGVGPDGQAHRLATDNAGNLAISPSVTISVQGPSFTPYNSSAFNVLSSTTTDINLTTYAGVNCPLIVCLDSNGGAATGFKVSFNTNALAPAGMVANATGHYVMATTTSQCWGPFNPGTWAHFLGVAATSSVEVDAQCYASGVVTGPTFTPSASPTSTVTPTFTFSASPTYTQTSTRTSTATPTFTFSASPTQTSTATPTFTKTFTASPTNTSTVTPSNSPSPTVTQTSTATPTFTQTSTKSSTATPTSTQTSTQSSTATPTFTQTSTQSSTATPTFTQTSTWTSTGTMTFTASPTVTQTATASPTVTSAPTGTATNTPFIP